MTRKEQGRTQILEAAARAIAEHGYHGMSMRELARATGWSLANFYNYFASKEDVLYAIQSRAFEALLVAADQAVQGVDVPAGRLYLFALNHVRYFAEHRHVMRVLLQEASALPPRRRAVVRDLKERYYQRLRAIVRDLMAEGCGRPEAGGRLRLDEKEVERTTYSVFGMLNWVYAWYEPARHGPPQDVARTIHRATLCGLVARCPHRVLVDVARLGGALGAYRSPLLEVEA